MSKLSALEDEQNNLVLQIRDNVNNSNVSFNEIYTKLEELETNGKQYTDEKIQEIRDYVDTSVTSKINDYETVVSDMILDASTKLD